MQNFTYVVYDENSGAAVIIDPSWDLQKISHIIEQERLDVHYIINTHTHFDHIIGNEQMAEATGAPVMQHVDSTEPHDRDLRDGVIVRFGSSELHVRHTPGHSKDSICLMGDDKIFTGDTLFVGSCGRVDLPGGSSRDLYHSIFDVLYTLNDDLVVYPGHDYGSAPTSTIGHEKRFNAVMQRVTEEQFVARMGW